MSFVTLLINVLGPVVAIAAVGAAVGPRLGIDLGSLSRLAYWVLGPAFVFNLFITTDLAGSVVVRLVLSGLAGMAAALAVGVLAAPVVGVGGRQRAAVLMTGAYGNVGNAGLAITSFALGEEALAAAGVLMLGINISGVTLGVALASSGDGARPAPGDGGSSGSGLATALTRAVLSPMPLAGLAALAVNASGAEVPLVVARPVALLAGAMIPVMLFTLGLQLAQTGGIRLQRPVALAAGLKLVVAPAAAWGAAIALGLTGDAVAAVLLQSAMPPAVFCVLVGIEYDLEPALVTDAVVLTTLASLATLPVVLAFVG